MATKQTKFDPYLLYCTAFTAIAAGNGDATQDVIHRSQTDVAAAAAVALAAQSARYDAPTLLNRAEFTKAHASCVAEAAA